VRVDPGRPVPTLCLRFSNSASRAITPWHGPCLLCCPPQLCAKCPDGANMYLRVLFFVAVVLGTFVVAFGVIIAVTKRLGGTLGASIFRARDFVTWTIITWQTLVQVRHAAGTQLFVCVLVRTLVARTRGALSVLPRGMG
jgi:hypothetical protein